MMSKNHLRDIPPGTLKITDFSLYTELAVGTDFLRDPSNTFSEPSKVIDHFVNCNHKLLYLSRSLNIDNLLAQVTTGNCALT